MENISLKLHSAIGKEQWDLTRDIIDRELRLIQQLLTENCSIVESRPNTLSPRQSDFLRHAIIREAPADVITQLISPRNINLQDRHTFTALHWVVRQRRWDMVSVLMKCGADVNLCDKSNRTPLHWAAFYDAPTDCIIQLVSSHNINKQDKDGITVLHQAGTRQRWDLVPVLLDCGADVNVLDSNNRTPLLEAVRQAEAVPLDIVAQLISADNIDMGDQDRRTALHWVVAWYRWDLMSLLIQCGADVNLCENYMRTPLHNAACQPDIVTHLISPYNINMRDHHGYTPLHFQVWQKRWHLVPVLVQHGADVSMHNTEWCTPLHTAIYNDAPLETAVQLISMRSINKRNRHGTPLRFAVKRGRRDLVQVLLQYGADPSLLDAPLPAPQPLVRSFKALCISAIRRCMPVKSDEAYNGLGLPTLLVEELKLKAQVEDLMNSQML